MTGAPSLRESGFSQHPLRPCHQAMPLDASGDLLAALHRVDDDDHVCVVWVVAQRDPAV